MPGLRRSSLVPLLCAACVLGLAPGTARAAVPPLGDTYLAARSAQQRGAFEDAVPQLLEVIHADGPLRPFAARALADAARELDDGDLLLSALDSWARTERLPATLVEANRHLGDHLLNRDVPDAALSAYRYWLRAPKDSRDRSRARWAVAQAYLAAGDAYAAHEMLWKIVHDDPSSFQARDALDLLPEPATLRQRYDVGLVHVRHRRWAEADQVLGALAAEQLPPAFEPQVLFAWAEARDGTAGHAEGRRAMEQLALGYPSSGWARRAKQKIASYWAGDRHYDEALAAYDDVVDHDPRHDAAVQALWDGAKLLQRRDPLAAAQRLKRLQATYPRHLLADEALRLRGMVLYKAERYAEAADAFREGYTLYPDRRQADDCAYWEGKCALALGDRERAHAAFARTLEHWPTEFYAYRAAQQLALLDDQPDSVLLTVLGDRATFGFAPNPEPERGLPAEFTAEPNFNPEAGEWLALLDWFIAHDLPEGRNLVPYLRQYTRTPAQLYALARRAAAAGDYETCVRLADGLERRVDDPGGVVAVLRLRFPEAWLEDIAPYALAYGVDPLLSLAVMREESHFRATIDSWAGARGVMQIMPSTGKWLGDKVPEAGPYTHDRLYDVPYNIRLGTYYLGYLLDQFDGNIILAVAGYNGGPGNVRRWVRTYGLDDIDLFVESIPYDETNEYVKKVLGAYGTYHRLAWRERVLAARPAPEVTAGE